ALRKSDPIYSARSRADADADVFLSGSHVSNGRNNDTGFFDHRQRKHGLDPSGLRDAERIRFAFYWSERESSAAFMLGAERGNFLSFAVHDDACHIGRLLRWCPAFDVDTVRQTGDQITTFGIDCDIDGLQENGNSLGGCLYRSAVLNDHGDDTVAMWYRSGKFERGGRVTCSVNGGLTLPCIFAVNARSHADLCSGRNAAFGTFDMESCD